MSSRRHVSFTFSAVKIADQASYNIPWGRQMLYTLKVLGTRLQLRLLEGCKLDGYPWSMTYTSDSDSQSSPPTSLLPIPLARTRLIEVMTVPFLLCGKLHLIDFVGSRGSDDGVLY